MNKFNLQTTLLGYESPILDIDFTWFADRLLVRFYADSGARFYYWDFGDGCHSYRKNPIHLYSAPGAYEVSLTVHDCVSFRTITKLIEVTYGLRDSMGWTDILAVAWSASAIIGW